MDDFQTSRSRSPFGLIDRADGCQSDPLPSSLFESSHSAMKTQFFSPYNLPLDFPPSGQDLTDKVASPELLQIYSLSTIDHSLVNSLSYPKEDQFSAQYLTDGTISPKQLQLPTHDTQTGNYPTEAFDMPPWQDLLEPGIQGTQLYNNVFEQSYIPVIPINGLQQSSPKEMPALVSNAQAVSLVSPENGPGENKEDMLPGIFCFQVNSNSPTVLQKARYSEKGVKKSSKSGLFAHVLDANSSRNQYDAHLYHLD
jgi:hypothetical protein